MACAAENALSNMSHATASFTRYSCIRYVTFYFNIYCKQRSRAALCYRQHLKSMTVRVEIWRIQNWKTWIDCQIFGTVDIVRIFVTIHSRVISGQMGEIKRFVIYLFIYFPRHAREIRCFEWFWGIITQKTWNHTRVCLLGIRLFSFQILSLLTTKTSKC